MFERLKIKIAVRQSGILGVVLVIALFLVLAFNIGTVYVEIDRKLDAISEIPYYKFFTGEVNSEQVINKNRDTMAIFVTPDGQIFLSDVNMFDGETIKEIVVAVESNNSPDGFLRVDEQKLAFRFTNVPLGYAIYLCDYTEEADNAIGMLLITLGAGIIGIICIALISVLWSRRTVAPVEQAFEKQQDLVANASHELKTPITIINTDLAILNGAENFTEEQKKWLDNIERQVNRMGKLVTEMLELARLEAKGKNQVKETVNISTVAEGVVLEAEALAFEKKVSFETDIKSDVKITASTANIEKLVYILVENALKYTPEGKTVSVKVSVDRKRAVLRVRNTGIGIAENDVEKLFDRFYRVDEAHSSGNSFGLGLAIAKSIVDLSGGKIGVDSKENEYTEFVVMFKQA